MALNFVLKPAAGAYVFPVVQKIVEDFLTIPGLLDTVFAERLGDQIDYRTQLNTSDPSAFTDNSMIIFNEDETSPASKLLQGGDSPQAYTNGQLTFVARQLEDVKLLADYCTGFFTKRAQLRSGLASFTVMDRHPSFNDELKIYMEVCKIRFMVMPSVVLPFVHTQPVEIVGDVEVFEGLDVSELLREFATELHVISDSFRVLRGSDGVTDSWDGEDLNWDEGNELSDWGHIRVEGPGAVVFNSFGITIREDHFFGLSLWGTSGNRDVWDLHGRLPISYRFLRRLRSLNLQNHSLSGAIPYQWGDLIELEALRVHNNNLSGIVPRSVMRLLLGELHTLTITGNDNLQIRQSDIDEFDNGTVNLSYNDEQVLDDVS